MNQIDIDQLFLQNNLRMGRLIASSKSTYLNKYDNQQQRLKVIFNANIVVHALGKVWYGDLDCNTNDIEKLQNIAIILNTPLYILREMDCRFGNEDLPINELIKKSVITVHTHVN